MDNRIAKGIDSMWLRTSHVANFNICLLAIYIIFSTVAYTVNPCGLRTNHYTIS